MSLRHLLALSGSIVTVWCLRLARSAHKAPRDDQLMRWHAYSLHMAAETRRAHILHLIKIHTVGAQGASIFIIRISLLRSTLGWRRARSERKGCLPAHKANPFSPLARRDLQASTERYEYPQESRRGEQKTQRRRAKSESAGSVCRDPKYALFAQTIVAQEAHRLALALTQPKVIIYA